MGTASTMACLTAALGMMPLKGASAPAVSSAFSSVFSVVGVEGSASAASAFSSFFFPPPAFLAFCFFNCSYYMQLS